MVEIYTVNLYYPSPMDNLKNMQGVQSIQKISNWIMYRFPKGSYKQTLYVCLPFTLLLTAIGLYKISLPVITSLSLFVLGGVAWTFMEYLVHRFVFHHIPTSTLGKALLNRFHIWHHQNPKDDTQVCVPFAFSMPVWGVIFGMLFLIGGGWQGMFFVGCGLAFMTSCYDIVHYRTHYLPAKGVIAKYLKAYHMSHHFKDHHRQFGVTSPVWDFVFKTGPV